MHGRHDVCSLLLRKGAHIHRWVGSPTSQATLRWDGLVAWMDVLLGE
jgi:hypothetical protein